MSDGTIESLLTIVAAPGFPQDDDELTTRVPLGNINTVRQDGEDLDEFVERLAREGWTPDQLSEAVWGCPYEAERPPRWPRATSRLLDQVIVHGSIETAKWRLDQEADGQWGLRRRHRDGKFRRAVESFDIGTPLHAIVEHAAVVARTRVWTCQAPVPA